MKYGQHDYTCIGPNRFQSSLEKNWLIKELANRSQVALEVGIIPVFTASLTMHRNGKYNLVAYISIFLACQIISKTQTDF